VTKKTGNVANGTNGGKRRPRVGAEPVSATSKATKEIRQAQSRRAAESDAVDPTLQELIEAWPELPQQVCGAILAGSQFLSCSRERKVLAGTTSSPSSDALAINVVTQERQAADPLAVAAGGGITGGAG
jgi:hypothetical protein